MFTYYINPHAQIVIASLRPEMGLPRRLCSPRRGLRSAGIRSTPLQIKAQNKSLKTPPGTSLLSTVPKSNSPWRTQPSFTYKLRLSRSLLPLSSPRLAVPHGLDQAAIPQTLEEIDQFLSSVWKDDVPISPEHSRKVSCRLSGCSIRVPCDTLIEQSSICVPAHIKCMRRAFL